MATHDAKKERPLQGDARSFGSARIRPVAIVKWAEIDPLIEHLELPDQSRLRLRSSIHAAVGRYLGDVQMDRRRERRTPSLSRMDRIAKTSSSLATDLEQLNHDLLADINMARPDGVPDLAILHLIDRLRHLNKGTVAARIAAADPDAGPRPKLWLDEAVETLLDACDDAKLHVVLRESGSKTVRKTVVGAGGALLLSIFQTFDRHLNASNLHGSITRVRDAHAAGSSIGKRRVVPTR